MIHLPLVTQLAADGTACSDANPCTQPDACNLGVCKPGADICGACEVKHTGTRRSYQAGRTGTGAASYNFV